MYRGCAKEVANPFDKPPYGNGGATLGEGSYWTDSLAKAQEYARKVSGNVWEVEFRLNDLPDIGKFFTSVDDLGANNLGNKTGVVQYFDVVSSLHGYPVRQWKFGPSSCSILHPMTKRL